MSGASLDVDDALAPYRGAFDARQAAHLLRRAGFGTPPHEVARMVAQGLDASVHRLLAGADQPDEHDLIQDAAAAAGIPSLQAWWAARMLRTSDPLREKLALFWHGHFATSADRVRDARLMLQHLRLFLDHGRARFGPLLHAVAQDPAMLLFLDAEQNRRGRPNENFARELFELFTLGLGAYTELDVQEAARAFTGWRRAGGRFQFVPALHDDGDKRVLHARGHFTAADVLDLTLAHAATARHLTRRLLRFFAVPDPPEPLVHALAEDFRRAHLDVGSLLQRLFLSRWFHSAEVACARILSPAEFVIGHLRTLGARANAAVVAHILTDLGQSLLRPPSVKGWDGEGAWINSVSAVLRQKVAVRIARGAAGGIIKDQSAAAALGAPTRGGPEVVARRVAERFLHRSLEPHVLGAIAARVARAAAADTRAAAALLATLTLPEASIG